MKNHYASPVDYWSEHVKHCPECQENPFGLCPTGFRVLGEISGMQADKQQLLPFPELLQKALVKMFLGNGKHSKG